MGPWVATSGPWSLDPESATEQSRIMSSPGSPSTRSNFAELSRGRCEELLAEQHVGRVAWNAADGPEALPVNYAWHVGQVVFRTVPYGAMAALARRTPVAFEVDHIDEQERAGWSVVVRGSPRPSGTISRSSGSGPPTSSCRGPSGVGRCSSPSRHAPSAVGAFRPGSWRRPIQGRSGSGGDVRAGCVRGFGFVGPTSPRGGHGDDGAAGVAQAVVTYRSHQDAAEADVLAGADHQHHRMRRLTHQQRTRLSPMNCRRHSGSGSTESQTAETASR